MRRVVGLNINGWKDTAARDWDPDEPDQRLDAALTLDGGAGGVAIRQLSGALVGGPQAALAPHGRGIGWGEIGNLNRRISLAGVLDPGSATYLKALEGFGATADALSRRAEKVVVTVPDHPLFDEGAQGTVLESLKRQRRANILLWRPVALFLYALAQGEIRNEQVGSVFRFVIHTGSGLEVQKLKLRADNEHIGHFAPERDGYGHQIADRLGLQSLVKRAHQLVLTANANYDERLTERSSLALKILTGEKSAGQPEIVRHNNKNWLEIVAPEIKFNDLFSTADRELIPDETDAADATFFATPLSNHFAEEILTTLKQRFPDLRCLPWNGIAHGALTAARIIEKGLPHYFDRLTPIKLAVLSQNNPYFEDLIVSDATLPANREYVSPPYRDLIWQRGKRELEFFVLKGDQEVRHWKTPIGAAPSHDMPVELRVRQTPGQSWAKLSLTSPEWEQLQQNPLHLDWATLAPDARTPEEILAYLANPPPVVPIRIVEPANYQFWSGNDRFDGILPALSEMERAGKLHPGRLATLLRRSFRDPNTKTRQWAISTDGSLPEELTDEDRARFEKALNRLSDVLVGAIAKNVAPKDNEILKCLTWSFTLCPKASQEAITQALEFDLLQQPHLLLKPPSARRVLTQGAGRAISGADLLKKVLDVLVNRQQNTDTLNAIAMILSRREEAPDALDRDTTTKILQIVEQELNQLAKDKSFERRFSNALSALGGLFRFRLVDRYALLASRDPIAATVRDTLNSIELLLRKRGNTVSQIEQKREILNSLCGYLDGEGDPNILIRIDAIEDSADASDD